MLVAAVTQPSETVVATIVGLVVAIAAAKSDRLSFAVLDQICLNSLLSRGLPHRPAVAFLVATCVR